MGSKPHVEESDSMFVVGGAAVVWRKISRVNILEVPVGQNKYC